MHGVLVVDKPSGPTSHDIVKQARQLFRTRAVGHAGTLDPMASGVLLLLFGDALKLSAYLTLEQKTYTAVVRFGVSTSTLDLDGDVVVQTPLADAWLTESALHAALEAERERTLQQPPAYSALKVAGVRAHQLARQGAEPTLPPRSVRVERLSLGAFTDRDVTLEVCVSKGYYVRSLARDIGLQLGVPSVLAALRRSASGTFSLAEATKWPPASGAAPLVPPAEAARRALPEGVLTETGARKAGLGQKLALEDFSRLPTPHGDRTRPAAWCNAEGRLVALGAAEAAAFVVVRGFPQGAQGKPRI